MATESGRDRAPLSEELFRHPRRFEFFQAVRLLQLLRCDRDRVGAATYGREAVQFGSDLSANFPTSDIANLEPGAAEEAPPKMTVPFMGLASPASRGSLPPHYARMFREERRAGNHAPADFIDLFNHRLISFFYRAWEKYRLAPVAERARVRGDDTFRIALLSIGGLGLDGEGVRRPFEVEAIVRWAGSLARGTMPAHALEDMVGSYFEVEANVEPFVAHWTPLDPDRLARLGKHGRVGVDLIAGSKVCTSQYRFRIRVGPMTWRRFQDLVPSGDGYLALIALVRIAVGAEQTFQMELVLRADEVPALRLSADADPDGPRFGWSTWLRSPNGPAAYASAAFAGEVRELPTVGAQSQSASEPVQGPTNSLIREGPPR